MLPRDLRPRSRHSVCLGLIRGTLSTAKFMQSSQGQLIATCDVVRPNICETLWFRVGIKIAVSYNEMGIKISYFFTLFLF